MRFSLDLVSESKWFGVSPFMCKSPHGDARQIYLPITPRSHRGLLSQNKQPCVQRKLQEGTWLTEHFRRGTTAEAQGVSENYCTHFLSSELSRCPKPLEVLSREQFKKIPSKLSYGLQVFITLSLHLSYTRKILFTHIRLPASEA